MRNLILNQYQHALGKYKKFASRLKKKQINRTFQGLSGKKQKQLLTRLDRLKSKLEVLRQKLILAGMGAFIGTILTFGEAEAQVKFEIPTGTNKLGLLDDEDEPFIPTALTIGPSPAFADLDGDNDQDLFLGKVDGTIVFLENRNDSLVFNRIDNPLSAVTAQFGYAQPAFVDWDSDGDMDLFLGGYGIQYFENTGTPTEPEFTERTGAMNPLSAIPQSYISRPTFANIDTDTDIDVAIGSGTRSQVVGGSGTVGFLINNGGTLTPDASKNITFTNFPFPKLADLDNDGDEDLTVGLYGSGDIQLFYYENDGSGNFTAKDGDSNPFAKAPTSLSPIPEFLDYDADGDKDLFLGDRGNRGVATDAEIRLIQNTSFEDSLRFGNVLVNLANDDKDVSPVFADIDKDDDLDLFAGIAGGKVLFFENENQTFTKNTVDNPLGGINIPGKRLAPRFVNVDGDDDLDLYAGLTNDGGNSNASIDLYTNDNANFTQDNTNNPLSLVDGEGDLRPGFVDIDEDSDLDVFVGGNANGLIRFFRNNNGTYVEESDANNPLGTAVIAQQDSSYFAPTFVDLDADGDMDAIISNTLGEVGTEYSILRYFTNDGSDVFTEQTGSNNPFDGLFLDKKADPTFADIDLDGDLDLYIGEDGVARITRSIQFFENKSTPGISILAGTNTIEKDATVNLGEIASGSTADTTLAVRNIGPTNLILSGAPTVSGDTGEFSVTGDFSNLTIAPGQQIDFTVTFSPTDDEVKNLAISFGSNDPDDATYTFNIIANDATSIFELKQGRLKIFPNPASERLQLSLENASTQSYKLSIVDLTGNEVFEQSDARLQGTINQEIDLSSLSKGVYLIRLEIDNQVITDRIVVY